MRTAVIHCVDPEITERVKAIMKQFLADLQNVREYTNGTELQFALMPGTDLNALDSALDRGCGTGYRGRVNG